MTDAARLSIADLVAIGMPRHIAYAINDMYVKTGSGRQLISITNVEQIIQLLADRSAELDKVRRRLEEIERAQVRASDVDRLRREIGNLSKIVQARPDDRLRTRIDELEKKTWL